MCAITKLVLSLKLSLLRFSIADYKTIKDIFDIPYVVPYLLLRYLYQIDFKLLFLFA
jgi:hypothetical protein